MTAQPGSDTTIFSRLVDILLPQGGYVMAIYEAYLDESGCDDGSRVLCVAGYLIRSDLAQLMEKEWRSILTRYALPYFHMVDCAHGSGVFEKLTKQQRISVEIEFINLTKKYTAFGFAAIVNPQRHEQGVVLDPYTFCLDVCLVGMTNIVVTPQDKVALFFESGHKNGAKASAFIQKMGLPPAYASHTFAKKEEVCLLQAADLLAWQCTKHLKDKVFNNRAPRKDFLNLMSHQHYFSYIILREGGALTVDYNPAKENERRDSYLKALFSEGNEHDQALEKHHKTFRSKWDGSKIVPNNNSDK